MSADNYYFIGVCGKWFTVKTGFMSDSYAPHEPPRALPTYFGTLKAAMEYAESEYSEYGVIVSDEAKALDAKAGAR